MKIGYEEYRFIIAIIAFTFWFCTKNIRQHIAENIDIFWTRFDIAQKKYSDIVKIEIELFIISYIKLTMLLWNTLIWPSFLITSMKRSFGSSNLDKSRPFKVLSNFDFIDSIEAFSRGFIQRESIDKSDFLHKAFSLPGNLAPAFILSIMLYFSSFALEYLFVANHETFIVLYPVLFVNAFLDSISLLVSIYILIHLWKNLNILNAILFLFIDILIAYLFSKVLYIYVYKYATVFSLRHLAYPFVLILIFLFFLIEALNRGIIAAIKDKLIWFWIAFLGYWYYIEFTVNPPLLDNIDSIEHLKYWHIKGTYFSTLYFYFSNLPITLHESFLFISAFCPTFLHIFFLVLIILTKILNKPIMATGIFIGYIFNKRSILNLMAEVVLVLIGVISLWPKSFSLLFLRLLGD